MNKYFVVTLIAVISTIVYVVEASSPKQNIAKNCESMGMFRQGNKVFTCQKVKP